MTFELAEVRYAGFSKEHLEDARRRAWRATGLMVSALPWQNLGCIDARLGREPHGGVPERYRDAYETAYLKVLLAMEVK